MLVTSDSSFLAHRSLHIWKKIGEGSFSKVYLAKFGDNENDSATLIATKVINKNRVSNKFVEKFLPRELDVMVKLRHPYIVQASIILWNIWITTIRNILRYGEVHRFRINNNNNIDRYPVTICRYCNTNCGSRNLKWEGGSTFLQKNTII